MILAAQTVQSSIIFRESFALYCFVMSQTYLKRLVWTFAVKAFVASIALLDYLRSIVLNSCLMYVSYTYSNHIGYGWSVGHVNPLYIGSRWLQKLITSFENGENRSVCCVLFGVFVCMLLVRDRDHLVLSKNASGELYAHHSVHVDLRPRIELCFRIWVSCRWFSIMLDSGTASDILYNSELVLDNHVSVSSV